jgi:aspartyl-tRNA(Asn)/glutamyl-tRNA(Gln) amidotransferase subunit C
MENKPGEIEKPSIDIDMVRHIARLIRLKLKDEEAAVFSQQFSQIIGYFDLLNELDTGEIQPANEISPTLNIYRDDIETPCMPRIEFLKNSPNHDDRFIKVPHP